jgi:hypothetical protein
MLRIRPSHVALAALAALVITGCSRQGEREQRAEWRSTAEKACMRSGQVKETPYIKVAQALNGVGSCGADHPFKVSAFTMDEPLTTASAPGLFTRAPSGGFLTRLNQEGTLTCPMVAAVDHWLEKVVQPAAMARFGQPVVELRTMGTYSCRRMNNGSRSARMSEHAYANAIDVGGFRLADGSIITVLKGWKGGLEEQNFLREVHAGACRNFATVLGPGADAFHYDHFHFDLARHGRSGNRSICRPYPQPVSPPNEGFPIDPGRNTMVSDGGRGASGMPPRDAYAMAPRPTPLPQASTGPNQSGPNQSGPILPGYRPPVLPVAPRNPLAEREANDLRMAPQRNQRPSGPPVMLYGRGHGPFSPLQDHEIDPQDVDEVTGSVGE